MIIGKSFIEYFEISPNVAKKTLHWPPNHPKSSNVISQGISVPRKILNRPPSRNHHQLDMEARDKAIALDEQRRLAGRSSIAHITTQEIKKHQPTPLYADMSTQTDFDKILLEPGSGKNSDADMATQEPPQTPKHHDSLTDDLTLVDESSCESAADYKSPMTRHCHTSEPVPSAPKPRPDLTRHSYKIDHQDSLKRMQAELNDTLGTVPSP